MHSRPKARTEDLIVERVEDELVVYDQRSQAAHALSREATAVWESCDGSLAASDIGEHAGLEAAAVEGALAELRANDLLDDEIAVQSGYSRREVAAKFAAIGGAAFAAPFILLGVDRLGAGVSVHAQQTRLHDERQSGPQLRQLHHGWGKRS